jgi:hypothetical protein
MDAMKIFLSHKGADKPLVRDYKSLLYQVGFDPWIDEDAMSGGTELFRGIKQGMKESCAAVFFLTPAFKDEHFLSTEINFALEEYQKKGKERFRILGVRVPEPRKPEPKIPDLLTQFVWIDGIDPLGAVTDIVRSLPIRLGGPRWRTVPNDDEHLRRIQGLIESPAEGESLPSGSCCVCGKVESYSGQRLYVCTGGNGKYWPSDLIRPGADGKWKSGIHTGNNKAGGTIYLVAVKDDLGRYIDMYNQSARTMSYCGIEIHDLYRVLHQIDFKATR